MNLEQWLAEQMKQAEQGDLAQREALFKQLEEKITAMHTAQRALAVRLSEARALEAAKQKVASLSVEERGALLVALEAGVPSQESVNEADTK